MDKIIELPLIRQQYDTEDKDWADRTCGICSLEMLLENRGHKKSPIMDLVDEALEINGYIPGIGWKHSAIVELAKKRGLNMGFIVQFPGTIEEKEKYLKFISDNIQNEKPLLASLYYQLDKSNGGHVVIINGTRHSEDDQLLGFFIQDPSEYQGQHNYFITVDDFLDYWRGGLIYLL